LSTGAYLPCDLDTTSVALSVMKPPETHIHSIMDDMLKYRSDAGIPWVCSPGPSLVSALD